MKSCLLAPAFQITGDGQNFPVPLPAYQSGVCPYDIQDYSVGTGGLSISTPTIPTGASLGLVIIVPPNGNANTFTLKGVSGDTGLALSTMYPWLMLPAAALSGLYLVASATTIVRAYWL